jgi:hypothetical protein
MGQILFCCFNQALGKFAFMSLYLNNLNGDRNSQPYGKQGDKLKTPNSNLYRFYLSSFIHYSFFSRNTAGAWKIFFGFYIGAIDDHTEFSGKSLCFSKTFNTVIEKVLHLPDSYLDEIISESLWDNRPDSIFIFSS